MWRLLSVIHSQAVPSHMMFLFPKNSQLEILNNEKFVFFHAISMNDLNFKKDTTVHKSTVQLNCNKCVLYNAGSIFWSHMVAFYGEHTKMYVRIHKHNHNLLLQLAINNYMQIIESLINLDQSDWFC